MYGCVYIMTSVGMCVYDRRGYVSKDVCKLWQAWIYMDVGMCGWYAFQACVYMDV